MHVWAEVLLHLHLFDQQVPPGCGDFVCFETVNDFMKQMIQLIPSFKKRCFSHLEQIFLSVLRSRTGCWDVFLVDLERTVLLFCAGRGRTPKAELPHRVPVSPHAECMKSLVLQALHMYWY